VARHGAPSAPADLVSHNCLCFMLSETTHDRWSFARDGEPVTVEVSGDIQCDDGDAVRRFALMGAGIAYKSRLDVIEDLRSGALVALCPEWACEPAPLYFACADRSQLRPAVRRLRDFLVERITAMA
jgi:DNA-binding transcriptional LysR family regulator